jgi:hypothetical protein
MSVKVGDEGLSYLRDKVTRINKRAVKMKLPGLSLIIEEYIPCENPDGTVYVNYRVSLDGTVPKLGPYILIACKESIKGDQFIRSTPKALLPANVDIPQWFFTSGMACQHCNVNRMRNDVFLVFNTDAPKYTQVGRSCLTDFLGMDVSNWLQQAEWIVDIDDMLAMAETFENVEHNRGETVRYLPLDPIFTYIYAVANRYGFVSKKKAQEDDSAEATIYRALTAYYDNTNRFSLRRKDSEKPPTAEEVLTAGKILTWFLEEILPNNDKHYFGDDVMWHNMEAMFHNRLVPLSMTGIATIPLIMYYKYKAEQNRNAERAVSNWVGEIGQKAKAQVKLVFKQNIESFYGVMTIHKFVTPGGNVLCWFQSAGSRVDINEGEELLITCTVKEFKEYRGQKETIVKGVKRC